MKPTSIIRFAGILVFAGVLHVSAAAAVTDTVLHAFKGGSDGATPLASLISVNGILYGTTDIGGKVCESYGCGTVFSVDLATRKETVLYAFKGGSDGVGPNSSLIDFQGTLYGTTRQGGGTGCDKYGCGTVFSLDLATHKETVLYAFKGGSDGVDPDGGLIAVKGTLYGTTAQGGGTGCDKYGCGTVFSLDLTTHKETVLHAFKGGSDGVDPDASLIDVNGTLYGTPGQGGGTGCGKQSCGTVFSLDLATRKETVVYAFKGGSDGASPDAGLIAGKGTFYGTTEQGGGTGCGNGGCGTVFSLDLATRKETVLYAFKGGTDGISPLGGVINVEGNFYGTTEAGGSGSCTTEGGSGCGTVFSLDPTTHKETALYAFKGGTDGISPFGGVINVEGTLYGTTVGGGGTDCSANGGCGTVFSVTP